MTTAGLNAVMGTGYYYGPCGKHNIEKEAEKLKPCAYAAQHRRLPVSERCCTVMEKKVKNPACLFPKRCNIADRLVGCKCGAFTLL